MPSNNETRGVQRKKSELEPDHLSVQYRKIGIKAVAAAADDKATDSGRAGGGLERKKHTKEKANG